MCRFIQQSLPGKMLKGLKVHVLGSLPPPLPQPDCAECCLNCNVDLAARVLPCVQVIALTPSPLLPQPPTVATPGGQPSSEATSTTPNKRKSWNCAYYTKKKLRILYFESAAAANSLNNEAVVTTDSATINSAVINGLSILADMPQQWIHGWSTPTALCAWHWCAGWQRVGMSSRPSTILSVPEASKRRQLFSVLSRIILLWLLRVSLQGSAL